MPRQTKAAKTVRLNFQVATAVRDRLEALRQRSGADTLTEVVRRALATYELLLDYYGTGGTLIIRDADGAEKELLLPEGKHAQPT